MRLCITTWVIQWHHGIKDFHKALTYFQKALSISLPQNNDRGILDTIDLSSGSNYRILTSLKGKATSLHKIFLNNRDTSYLQSALAHFSQAERSISYMRANFSTEQDESVLAKESMPIYEDGIRVALRLFQHSRDTSYLHTAFHFIQANKSLSLFESLQDRYARHFSGIPKQTLDEENHLKSSLFAAQKEYRVAVARKNYPAKLASLQQEILARQRAYDYFIEVLEDSFPQYHALKYGIEFKTIP